MTDTSIAPLSGPRYDLADTVRAFLEAHRL